MSDLIVNNLISLNFDKENKFMKKCTVEILIIMLFIVGCDSNKEVSQIDKIRSNNNHNVYVGTLSYTEWNGHRYVCRSVFYRGGITHNPGGITHDPDCPYCKNRDK